MNAQAKAPESSAHKSMKCVPGRARRHAERRIEKNARVVIDNFGCTMKVTRRRRILAVLNVMTGRWEPPTFHDGEVRRGSPYIYVPPRTNLTPVYATPVE